MSLAIVVLVAAVAIGLLTGGSWRRLAEVPVKRLWLVVGALLAQAAGALTSYTTGLAVSAALALAFCAYNARVPGVPLVTLGLVANAVVVGVNGAMPVSIDAAYHARVPIAAIAAGTDARHEIAGDGTALRWLGDVVPVPLPIRPEVVSAGDVLVVAGLAQLVVTGMLPTTVVMGWRRRKERHDGEESPQASRA